MKFIGLFFVGVFIFLGIFLAEKHGYSAGFADASKNATCSVEEYYGYKNKLSECDKAYEQWKERANQCQVLLSEVMSQCSPNYKGQE